MSCLTSVDLQALVDGEAGIDARLHVADCPACAARLRERERMIAAMTATFERTPADLPPHLAHRVDAALIEGAAAGATRLRLDARQPRRRAFWSASLAAVAATAIAIFFVAPLLKEPSTVSAAEILAASASRLHAPLTGVEVLEYELVVDGMPREMMTDHDNGTYRVWKAIDHDHPGRFRFASFGTDGRPISSIAQDPLLNRRVMLMSVEGQAYRFETSLPADTGLSLPELERLHLEATISMMRASGNQLLQVVDAPDGQEYRVEVQQQAAGPSASPVWDLSSARLVIKAADYRITEFAVTGTVLKRPYSVSYKLISRTLGASLQADAFDVPQEPGQMAFTGEGSVVPTRDVMVLAFRELSRLKQAR